MSSQIANTIATQLGGTSKLSAMLGAKNFVALPRGLTFKVGRGAKNKATHVTVKLDGDDTYSVEFIRVREYTPTSIETLEGLYVENMRDVIEDRLGMYLSL